MRCYLVRHAQTTWNGENRIQGQADRALSPIGLTQAEGVGNYFAAIQAAHPPLDALYTSHLTRSVQTAQAIAQQTGLTPSVEPDFSEISFGLWEGLTAEEINARFGGMYDVWQATPSRVQIPGAESLERFRHRVRSAFARVVAAHRGEDSLILVTHGGVIASLLADCLDADYDRLLRGVALENGGISALSAETTPPHVLWVNATTHLILEPVTTGSIKTRETDRREGVSLPPGLSVP